MQYLGVDLVGCRRMPDRQLAHDVLGMLCGRLDMHPLGTPQVESVGGDRGGYSGSLIVDESHITFHAFKNYGLIYFDVLSCKPFDTVDIAGVLKDYFLPIRTGVHEIKREPLGRRVELCLP